jgi:hypothetical protein
LGKVTQRQTLTPTIGLAENVKSHHVLSLNRSGCDSALENVKEKRSMRTFHLVFRSGLIALVLALMSVAAPA